MAIRSATEKQRNRRKWFSKVKTKGIVNESPPVGPPTIFTTPAPQTVVSNPTTFYRTIPMITLNGMVFTNNSFSIVTRGLALGLLHNNCEVSIDAWSEGSRAMPVQPEIRELASTNSRHEIGIRISHPNSFNSLRIYKYKIGKAYFETNKFPDDWVASCNRNCDQVWVSSTFNKEVCERSGVENVFVVHDGYDPDVFYPNGNKYNFGLDKDTFVFLTVGESQKRKGTDILYQAFTEEFKDNEKVALVYKSYSPNHSAAERYVKKNRIVHILKNIPYNEMGSLYRAANCFVLPTYGEGAGICNLEAMACGVPVITTNWSAHLDYCNNTNSYLIEGVGFEPAYEGDPKFGEWIIPSVDQLKMQMRYVFERQKMARIKANKAIIDAKRFTWDQCAKEAIGVLSIISPDSFIEEVIY